MIPKFRPNKPFPLQSAFSHVIHHSNRKQVNNLYSLLMERILTDQRKIPSKPISNIYWVSYRIVGGSESVISDILRELHYRIVPPSHLLPSILCWRGEKIHEQVVKAVALSSSSQTCGDPMVLTTTLIQDGDGHIPGKGYSYAMFYTLKNFKHS